MLQAVRRCRRLASAPGAARLVFSFNVVQQETIKQSKPFTLNDFLSLAEASRQEDDQHRKKEREGREKERKNDLRSLKSMLSLPPF